MQKHLKPSYSYDVAKFCGGLRTFVGRNPLCHASLHAVLQNVCHLLTFLKRVPHCGHSTSSPALAAVACVWAVVCVATRACNTRSCSGSAGCASCVLHAGAVRWLVSTNPMGRCGCCHLNSGGAAALLVAVVGEMAGASCQFSGALSAGSSALLLPAPR